MMAARLHKSEASGVHTHVLGIAGSPRRGGNSDALLEAALEGARDAGSETHVLVAAEAGLEPCQGCDACARTGECVKPDAWPDVFAEIDAADAIVVASPVYFATVPGVLKILYDRMQPYWVRAHVLKQPRLPRRPGAAILVRAGGDPYGFDAAEATTRSVLAVLGVDVIDVLKVSGVDEPGEVMQRPEVMEDARLLGRVLAIEAGRGGRWARC